MSRTAYKERYSAILSFTCCSSHLSHHTESKATMHHATGYFIGLVAFLPTTLARTYRASFTQYGEGDGWGSANCNTATAACGFYSYPGYNAAVSQNLYGVGPGAGAGPACGTCWHLEPETDSSGNELHGTNWITVKVNNLCPAQGNPLCAQNGLTGVNQYGMRAIFKDERRHEQSLIHFIRRACQL